MDSHVQAALALIISRPGIDSVELERLLELPPGSINRRTYRYVQRGLIRVEKKAAYSRYVNAYFPTPELVSNFSTMGFKRRERNTPKIWSNAEIEILMRYYPNRDTAEMAQEFGVSIRAVWCMATVFGVTKTREYMQEAARKTAARNNSLPPELREVIRLHNKLKRKLHEKH